MLFFQGQTVSGWSAMRTSRRKPQYALLRLCYCYFIVALHLKTNSEKYFQGNGQHHLYDSIPFGITVNSMYRTPY